MVLRPRAAAIWMTACPTPLLDAFWMTESPVEPERDSSQVLETCNRSRASSLRPYYIRQEMECLGSQRTGGLAAALSQTLECCSIFSQYHPPQTSTTPTLPPKTWQLRVYSRHNVEKPCYVNEFMPFILQFLCPQVSA